MQSKSSTIIERRKGRTRAENKGVIHPKLLFRLAYKNLFYKRLRTSLTILGVIIGIGSIVFLLSFGFGLQNLVSKQVVGSNSVQTIDVTSPRSKILKLNSDTVKQIRELKGVSDVAVSYNSAGKLKNNGSQTESVVYGVDSTFIDLSSLEFSSGKNFDTSANSEVIINSALAKAIGVSDVAKAKGQKISISFEAITSDQQEKKTITKDLTLQGVFTSDSRAEAFIDQSHFVAAGVESATQLKVVVPEKNNLTDARKTIESLGFTTTSPLDTVEQINQFFTLLRFILIGFGGIGMIVAILGMFNTLTISLLERTREIGLMISLGARKQDINRMFITEALFLSLLGGFIGVVGAVLIGMIGNFILNNFASRNGVKEHISAFVVSPTLALVVLALSGLIGLIVVYFPARRASMTDPIEALHND